MVIFKQRNTLLLIIILSLVLIASFTPIIPTLTGVLNPPEETPQPTITPTQPPQPPQTAQPPRPTEPPQLVEITPQENALSFSEKELKDKLYQLFDIINRSGEAQIEYIRMKLE